MEKELEGKVAIVTGGASGIGRATAELFVAEGAAVVIADIDSEEGESLAEELGSAATFRQTDVGDPEEVQALVDFAIEQYGDLNIMFNNAGISGTRKPVPLLKDSLEDFLPVLNVNLFGVMRGSQCAARHMARQGSGAIINTTSVSGLEAGPCFLSYRSSKAAVIHFSKCIALELAGHGIRVNCIAPGHIQARMTEYDMAAFIKARQPLQRQGMPVDVANAALYLASDRSAQVTGLVLPVDGGTNVGRPLGQM